MNPLSFIFAVLVYIGIGIGLAAGGYDRDMARCGHANVDAGDVVFAALWPSMVVAAVTFAIVYGEPQSQPKCAA